MIFLCALHVDFHELELVAVADCDGLEFLNLNGKLVDNAPCDDLLSRDPKTGFLITGLSKEKLKVQKIAETTPLEYLNRQSRQKWILRFQRCLLCSTFQSADKTTLCLIDAVVKQGLKVAPEGRKLLDFQVLSSLESQELSFVDSSKEQIVGVTLVVQCKVENFLASNVTTSLGVLDDIVISRASKFNFKPKPSLIFVIQSASNWMK